MTIAMSSRNAVLGAVVVLVAGCATAPGRLTANNETPLEECTQTTATRIRSKDRNDCQTASATKSFSADEIQSTGELNLSDALRRLDPTFQ
jgi:hypothetical protein